MRTIRAEDLRPGMTIVGFYGDPTGPHVAEEVRFPGHTPPPGSLLLVHVVTPGGDEFRCYGNAEIEVEA